MKRKLIPVFCIIAITAAAARAQAPPKAPPLALPGPGQNVPPSAEAKQLAAQISGYATAQCGGKGADAAPDCRIKALWAATQCPDQMTPSANDTKGDSRRCSVPEHGFEYDVASIKPHKDDGTGNSMVGSTSDGYRAINVTMKNTVLNAYSTGLQIEITGGPNWADDTRFDIEAKYVPEVADAMKKLSPEDRSFVRRYMMQHLLKERMNFAAHVDTKEVPAYDLVVGKNGSKMKIADPNSKEIGTMRMQMDQGKMVLTSKGMAMANLAANLSGSAGRPVFDKTGLVGMYEVRLEFAREQGLSAAAPDGGATGSAPALPADPAGPSLLSALEDQLGLKLVSSRGPMQVVVIEHIEKPDAN